MVRQFRSLLRCREMYEAWVETVVGQCPEAIKNQRWFEQKRRFRKRKKIRLIVKENVKLGTRMHRARIVQTGRI